MGKRVGFGWDQFLLWPAVPYSPIHDGKRRGNKPPAVQVPASGIIFEEYRGQARDADGTVRKFIADDEAHAFPMGTMDAFETLFAPADFVETTNTMGLELYAKQEIRKFGRGVDLHTQSNPLPICYRPGVLVKLTSS